MLSVNKFILFKLFLLYTYVCLSSQEERDYKCEIPHVIRGAWFSWEGKKVNTEINAEYMTDRGKCILMEEHERLNYTFIFKKNTCYHCVKLIVRTINVLEKTELNCVNLPEGVKPTINDVCRGLKNDQQLITLFSKNHKPVNCRSSLEGVWKFAYQNRFRFTGECYHEDAQIRSCQTAGTQFLITNQKFNITYKKCENMNGTFDGVVEFSCLGNWFVGKNHFFAVVNTKESREDEKYRCFLRNRDDDLYIGTSITAECNTLNSVERSPERLRIIPIKSEIIEPRCQLPQNMSGDWINMANNEANVVINETHIVETWNPDEGRERKTIYTCQQQRDHRFMMARLAVDGCQTDYICFEFIPRHHNIIRFRKSVAVVQNDFSTVCSWAKFQNSIKWKYDMFIKKNPVPVRCPVAGKFRFTQRGDILFETKILGGVTLAPRPLTYCKQNISDFSVCDYDQKEIQVDENYCLSVDYRGRPLDIDSDPDYKMKCIGYYFENLQSYLITYDELDPFSNYRCWVYQRAELNRVLMSQAVGPHCHINQTAKSYNWTEGAAVAINMIEYERERDECPMLFDSGKNPWKTDESHITIFKYNQNSAGASTSIFSPLILTLFLIF